MEPLSCLPRTHSETWMRNALTGTKEDVCFSPLLSCQYAESDVGSIPGDCLLQDDIQPQSQKPQIGTGPGNNVVCSEVKVMPHSTPLTLSWLADNYELAEGVCIPRHVIYKHYCDFCQQNAMVPVNPASFGKIIRQKFKMVKNRRLGTRGYSTYHYYGIGIRSVSVYYEEQYSSTNLPLKRGLSFQVATTPASSRMGQSTSTAAPLPQFPNLQDVSLPAGIPAHLFHSFFTMYRAHCLRIYNSICRSDLDEVKEFLLHFWKGVPQHLKGILNTNAVINMVGVCDCVLYRSITNIFVPSIHKTISPGLLDLLNKLVPLLDGWFYSELLPLPANLRNIKKSLVHHFCRMLRRLLSLNQIWLSVVVLLNNSQSASRMLLDWRSANIEEICCEVVFGAKATQTSQMILSLFKEFEMLLENHVGLGVMVQWLETVVNRCVIQVVQEHGQPIHTVAQRFLLIWVTVGTRILRDLTLTSTCSFGSFHMLSLLANDYLAHCIELLEGEERYTAMLCNISLDTLAHVSSYAPDATLTRQDINRCTDESEASFTTSFPFQSESNWEVKQTYECTEMTVQRQPGILRECATMGSEFEDYRVNMVRRCEFLEGSSITNIYNYYEYYDNNTGQNAT